MVRMIRAYLVALDQADLPPHGAPVDVSDPVLLEQLTTEMAPQATPPPEPAPKPIATRSRRRRGWLPDTAMVSFNCRMMVALRGAVRVYAAEHDVDIQDVVEDALAEYLGARGISVPRRPLPGQ